MEIRLLGLVEAVQDGRAVPLGGAKPRSLLAILALHANATVSADRLIEGLWGEEPPATAPKLVQVLVSQLRKQLASTDAEIVTRGRGYELRVDPEAVDALRFERLVASGENGAHAGEALALWRGPPLDDLANEPFAGPEIRRLEDLWLRAREAAIDSLLAKGRHTEALGELDDLIREHPLREGLHVRRMLALYRCGQQADALAAFREARQILLDEVGLEPGPELRRLNDGILRQDPELDGPLPAAFPDRPRRRHRPLFAAAAAVLAGVAVLAVTQLTGSDGLDRIAEDATGEIDPGSGRIVSAYAVGHAPDALVAGGGSVWTANGRDGTVSRVDRGQVTSIPVGGEPTALAFGNGSLWVADGENRAVMRIDAATNRVLDPLPAGNASRGVAVAGGAVWVASAIDAQVRRIDIAHPGRSKSIEVPGGPAVIAAGAGAVWVAGEEDAVVTELDPRSGAVLQAFGAGNGPAGIAVGYGGVWVANRDDGTVTRIDVARHAVSDTLTVGGRPVAVAAGLGAIWVADASTNSVIRIDPRTRGVSRHIPIGSAPSALAVGGGSVWAAAVASSRSHRGGTLRFVSAPPDCGCLDGSWPELSLVYDGLLAYRRIGGAAASTIVADLATSVPQPADGGRTYTFQLRSGLRFSDGTPVRPEDFRASIEREVRSQGQYYFGGILGANACRRRQCDLSQGIVTDPATRRITIRLRRPDTEFVDKLALPLGDVLPAGTPATELKRGRPPAGTGPYTITAFAPKRGVQLERNPRFRSWSAEARPDGYPDTISVRFIASPAARVAAVQHGQADAVVASGPWSGSAPLDAARALPLLDPIHVHSAPAPITIYMFLNTRERPFDDPRVRLALNLAIDRRRAVELSGGSAVAGLTCQLLPPGLPGYAPVCPFTRDATPGGGTWSAPDLPRARRLVAASGTRGAPIEVWAWTGQALGVIRYAAGVLKDLGYHARVRTVPDQDAYFRYVDDSRHHVQAGWAAWSDDYLTASSFFGPFSCDQFVPASGFSENISEFCDPAVDAGRDAALAAQGAQANARWSALERRVLASAPAVPLFNPRNLMLVSDRVGNVQIHPELGPLLDQLWVR